MIKHLLKLLGMQIWIKYIGRIRQVDKYLNSEVAYVKYHQREWLKGEATAELVEEGEGLEFGIRISGPKESACAMAFQLDVVGSFLPDGDMEAIPGSEGNIGKGKL